MSEQIEGRNAVLEAFRSGKCVDKLFVLDRCQDGPVRTIRFGAGTKGSALPLRTHLRAVAPGSAGVFAGNPLC